VAFDVQAGGTDLIFPHHELSASHARVAFGGSDGHKFARRYVHAGMVRFGGEKMSKSLGNLVFVSALLEDGADPMAIRLAILAHHYRQDWDWTGEGLDEGMRRLGKWRKAVAAALGGSVEVPMPADVPGGTPDRPSGTTDGPSDAGLGVLAAIRERIANDLDAPGALAVVDAWADGVLGATSADSAALTASAGSATSAESAALVKDAVDALLGVRL
jgi:L-cysteine:1D-myo-inositol 2-amino-2-deoxy-alpha-D-glucopyranoside ligase